MSLSSCSRKERLLCGQPNAGSMNYLLIGVDGHDRFVRVQAHAMVGSESVRNTTSSFQCLRCVVNIYIYI